MCLCNRAALSGVGGPGSAPAPASTEPVAHDCLTSARLPTHVSPSRYDLTLLPNLLTWTFAGYLCAHITVAEATKFIQMHALDMEFLSITLTPGHLASRANPLSAATRAAAAAAASPYSVSAHAFDAASQRVLLTLASEVPAGAYTLEIQYNGVIGDNMAGLYRSTSVDADGTTHRVACTQFEATDARRCLPCWDEPAYKAVYGCTVLAEAHYTVLSNMPVLEQSTVMADTPGAHGLSAAAVAPKGYISRHFGDTPLMSSYLLAFVIGEFDYVQKTTEAGVDLKVFTPQGKASQGRFSLELAVKALDYFAKFFGEPFPLPKLDLIAIPDFAAGAMENWGLITYRDTYLLVDPATTTSATLRQTARTVCHEIAHMWFGNLVTMDWWSYLWLNEGFARYCEFMAVNHAFPDWNVWQWFVADPYNLALTLDATPSSHAIEVEVNMPEEINSIFDAISYAKGASVIRMLATYMGDAFAEGVRAYLKRYKYQNTRSADLWGCLNEAWERCGRTAGTYATQTVSWVPTAVVGAAAAASSEVKPSIMDIMVGWTGLVNYPVVTVRALSESLAEGTATFRFEQRSILAMSSAAHAGDARLWAVMLTVAAPLSATPEARHSVLFNGASCEWTYRASAETVAKGAAAVAKEIAALKFNADCSAVARMHYPDGVTPELKALVSAKGDGLPAQDKLGLLRDTVAMFEAGKLPIGEVISVFLLFTQEDNLPVLTALSANVCSLLGRHSSHGKIAALRRSIREAFAAQYKRFGWGDVDLATGKPSDSVERSKRVAVLAMMVAARDPLACTEGLALYNAVIAANADVVNGGKGKTDLSMVAPDLQGMVFALGASHAGRVVDFSAPLSNDFEAVIPAAEADAACERAFTTLTALHAGAAGSTSAQLKAVSGLCALGSIAVREAKTLPWILEGSTVRMQDKPSALASFASGKGEAVLWRFITSNWAAFYARFQAGYPIGLRTIVTSASINRRTAEEADEVEQFFKANPCPEAKAGVERVLDVVRDNAAKLPKECADLDAYYA